MTLSPKHEIEIETEITLPALYIEKKKVGNNYVHQIGETQQVIQVEIFAYKDKCALLKDPWGREIYLHLYGSSSRGKYGKYEIKGKKAIRDIVKVNKTTKFEWVSHPTLNSPQDPGRIAKSWRNKFSFQKEDFKRNELGLRTPQIGALHAIASHWTVSDKPATIVMPTGTGKTEAMLATLVYRRCKRVLVVVPSDVLRTQIFWKFCTLGVLRYIGVIDEGTFNPRVALIHHGIPAKDEAAKLAKNANVLVATASVLNACSEEAQKRMAMLCSHLFVDEAHHLPAKTWETIHKLFNGKCVVQFTATPFRRDGKRIEGEIIYDYPLEQAQKEGYCQTIVIHEVEEWIEEESDEAIAKRAIECLRKDLDKKWDHLLMARAQNIGRAKAIHHLYLKEAHEFAPVLVHSKLTKKDKDLAKQKLASRESRILVCVDMFREGYDLPNLKVAAMHDIYKSLAVTLQFVGRFTRIGQKVGEASIVLNVSEPKVRKELKRLYAQLDWNLALSYESRSAITKEKEFHKLVESFSGRIPPYVLWNLRPAFSTVIYRTKCNDWMPGKFESALPARSTSSFDTSDKVNMLISVIFHKEEVPWGNYKDIKDQLWSLAIAYWDSSKQLLFIHCSDSELIDENAMAEALCGEETELVNGPYVYLVFHGIDRVMAKNLGTSRYGVIRYTMYIGPDVAVGIDQVTRAQSELNNVFGWGYEAGDRVGVGCSLRRGKVWSLLRGRISEWRNWCDHIGRKVLEGDIEEIKFLRDFLKPVELTERPALVPLAIEWGEQIVREPEERTSVFIGKQEYKVHDINLRILLKWDKDPTVDEPIIDGPIEFEIASEDKVAMYELVIAKDADNRKNYRYRWKNGPAVSIKRRYGDKIELSQYMHRDPFVILYADGSFSYNSYFVPAPCVGSYDGSMIESIDWSGINIRRESQGPRKRRNTIQYRMIQHVRKEFNVVFNDDDAGEAADIIAIRREPPETIILSLIHCKFSSKDVPGARIKDMYELCGQAQKCIRWKHNGIRYLVDHMKRREERWKKRYGKVSRFIEGNPRHLSGFKKLAGYSSVKLEVIIVQPGLSKAKVTEGILQLLGSTELYLKKTADAELKVICSE